jgi:hypothetical protein
VQWVEDKTLLIWGAAFWKALEGFLGWVLVRGRMEGERFCDYCR